MRPALLIALLIAFSLSARAEPPAWQTVIAADGRTSVEMPAGTKSHPAATYAGTQWLYEEGEDFALLFAFSGSSSETPRYPPEKQAAVLSEVQASVQARFPGSVLEHAEDIHLGSVRGRAMALTFERKGMKVVYNARLFLTEARLIQVVAVTSEPRRNDPRVARFLVSLKLP